VPGKLDEDGVMKSVLYVLSIVMAYATIVSLPLVLFIYPLVYIISRCEGVDCPRLISVYLITACFHLLVMPIYIMLIAWTKPVCDKLNGH
jgi:hypothetical protein